MIARMPGRLRAIYVKRFKGGPMDSRETATLVAGRGLAGNAHQGGRRQVILLDDEAWTDATAELGVDLDPSARRGWVEILKNAHMVSQASRTG